ncbi:hypothetical protein ABE033_10345 [Priestia megaterium]
MQQEECNNKIEGYYSFKECKEILGFNTYTQWNNIIDEYQLNYYRFKGFKGIKFFKKTEVHQLKEIQNEFRQKYYGFHEAQQVLGYRGQIHGTLELQKFEVDILARPLFPKAHCLYLKEEIDRLSKIRHKEIQFHQLDSGDNFETFLAKLNIRNLEINKLGKFTSKSWIDYIRSYLKRTHANKVTSTQTINNFLNCTEVLIEVLKVHKSNEVYSLKSNEINIMLNKIPIRQGRLMYPYFKVVNDILVNTNLQGFSMNLIHNPRNRRVKNPTDKSIYTFKEYKSLYDYIKDITKHKDRAIRDVLREVANEKCNYYAPAWLYVLLHMNNCWRHSDVIKFPRVNLTGTRIENLEWLVENELSDDEANYIIRQVYNTKVIINKTQVENQFFCSNDLKKTIATAIAICELRTQILYPLSKSIVHFNNKNGNFRKRAQNELFQDFDKNFQFSSKKMNSSLLTYIYVILSKKKDGKTALATAKRLRGHKETETTNIYINIPEEELNFLTKQLFERGAFGYIYDALLDLMNGVEIDREKRTTEITILQQNFGGILKIEEMSGFLREISNEKQAVIDKILVMGIEEAKKFIHKIDTNQLPSKEDNIQCMVFSETGCVKKGKGIPCSECVFSIPNYYTLSTLGVSLQKRLDTYTENGNVLPAEQRKSARLLYRQLEIFAQAINRFGADNVYYFLSDSPEEFRGKLYQIGSLKEKFKLT